MESTPSWGLSWHHQNEMGQISKLDILSRQEEYNIQPHLSVSEKK